MYVEKYFDIYFSMFPDSKFKRMSKNVSQKLEFYFNVSFHLDIFIYDE